MNQPKPTPSAARDLAAENARLREALSGVLWKIRAYGSHWEPSQAEIDAIRAALEGRGAENGNPFDGESGFFQGDSVDY